MNRRSILFLCMLVVLPSIARAQVTLVKDFYPPGSGNAPWELTVMNGVLYFTVQTPDYGRELWRSDGTTGGTTLVKDSYPGPLGGDARYLTVSGGKLFFVSADGPSHDRELWVSDGTEAGTVKIDINPAGASNPEFLTDLNGTLFFAATHSVSGRELWKSDGSGVGTVVVTDFPPVPSWNTEPTDLARVGNLLYFSGTFMGSPRVACVTDGTFSGTVKLGGGTFPREFTKAGPPGASRVYFVADAELNTHELYSTNGTAAGTALVKKVNPSGSSDVAELKAFDDILLFSADDGVHGSELWRSDGTSGGTYMLKNLNAQPIAYPYVGYSWPRDFTNLGNISVFSAQEPATGRELWITDGTPDGTVVIDVIPGGSSGLASGHTPYNGEVYFTYDDGVHGYELWRTVGMSGAVLVNDIWPVANNSIPSDLTVMGDALYFVAHSEGIQSALWRYNSGTTDIPGRLPRPDVLLQNTPNPFNPSTRIAFELGQREHVTLAIYDVQGALIRTLADRTFPSGHHAELWDGRDNEGRRLASGVYFIKLLTADGTFVRKATLLK